MQVLYKCDKCGGLQQSPLTEVTITRGDKSDETDWRICRNCELMSQVEYDNPIELTALPQGVPIPDAEIKPARTDGKRVIRTKSTGDRVYLIDETAKTKAWVTSPDILEKLGFTLNDVEDIDDSALVGYAMTASVYRVED